MNEVFVEAVGIAAPGLPNWRAAVPVLSDAKPYAVSVLPPHAPALLPPNERRRATPTVRLALQAAEDAVQATSLPAATLGTVFASSDADLGVIHRICSALISTPRMVSPTDFHNSVHNAAAGYWSIGVGSRTQSSTISAHDYSFAAGLTEACAATCVDGSDTLLVAFDLPPPEPLYAKRPIANPVGVALILTRQSTQNSMATVYCERTQEPESKLNGADLEALRRSNPAARGLPLLQQLARKAPGRVILPLNRDTRLAVSLRMV